MNYLERLLKMEYGATIHLNWFEEGGAEVTRSLLGWELYEVPHYGGLPRFYNIYTEDNLQELIEEVDSWT